jgi:molybdate/tungstate transport system ATP-binding protein
MLELDGLVTAYDTFQLGPIDLTVENEVVSVLGPSGSGKTTLLSTIAGITTPDAGTLTLNGTDLTERPPEERATVLVFQEGALFPHMTAKENITYAASGERVDKLAETLEITDILGQQADTLSGGERQRVALARSLAADPAALLLDEPLANLDAPIKRRLRDELRDLLASLEIPVVYVTHDQRQATVIGDRIAVMENGRFHQIDTPTEVFDHPTTPFVASFTGSVNLFQAQVIGTDSSLVLEWGDSRIETPQYEYGVDDEVQFCIRPEYVTIAGIRDADRSNVFDGRIVRRIFEGDDYFVTVVPDGMDEMIEIKVSPPNYERLGLDEQERVQVVLEKDAIHVLGMNTSENRNEKNIRL